MKILLSENSKPLEKMEQGKVRLTVNGEDPENIWVARDHESKKMYLLNHALAFFPFPSWGTEFPLQNSIDVAEIRGESPDDTVLTVHKEAYDNMKKHLNEEGILQDSYHEEQSELQEKDED